MYICTCKIVDIFLILKYNLLYILIYQNIVLAKMPIGIAERFSFSNFFFCISIFILFDMFFFKYYLFLWLEL